MSGSAKLRHHYHHRLHVKIVCRDNAGNNFKHTFNNLVFLAKTHEDATGDHLVIAILISNSNYFV